MSIGFRIGLGVGLLALVGVAVRALDWEVLRATLAELDPRWVLVGLAANLASVALGAARWRAVMAGQVRASLRRLFGYAMQGFGMSLLVPGPSNELVRVYLLRQRHGAATPVATALVASDKLVNGFCLSLFVLPLPLRLNLEPAIELVFVGLGAGGVAVVLGACVVVRRLDRSGWPGRWRYLAPFSPGLGMFRDGRIFRRGAAWGMTGVATDVVALMAYMRAVGIDTHVGMGVLALLGVVVSFVLPAVPGRVGSLEAGTAGALVLVGTPVELATAFALTFHAAQFVAVLVGGLDGISTLRAARAAEP